MSALTVKLRGRMARENRLGGDTSRAGLAVVAVLLMVYFELDAGGFISSNNFESILNNSYPLLIVGIAAAMLLISGNIDLSVGGMFGLLAVIGGIIVRDSGSVFLAITGTLAAGLVLGWLNGTLVRFLTIGPLIVTLGTALIFRGLAYAISGGSSIFGFPASFSRIGATEFLGLSLPIWVGLAFFAVVAIVLRRSVFGLRTYAIGGNPQAARLTGVSVPNHVTVLYMLSGLSVAVAAVLTIAQVGSATGDVGINFEFDVLTAVILGGVGLGASAGTGKPFGVLIGVLTIGILRNGMIFIGLEDFWQRVATGTVLLLALAADQIAAWRRRQAIVKAADRIQGAADDAGEAVAPESAARKSALAGLEPLGTHAEARAAGDRPFVLRCSHLAKRFGGVFAVKDVSFSVRAGEIVCLLGDNGAGKTTVLKLITGVERPDAGEIEVNGREVSLKGPADARELGIAAVYQDLALYPNLGAAYNLVLGQEPRRLRRLGQLSLVDEQEAQRLTQQRLNRLGARLSSLFLPVASLSGGQRQSVAIARVASDEGSIAVLDEPTAALGVQQTRNVLRLVRTLADHGTGVVMITHDFETVLSIADRVVVLHLGRVAYDGPAQAITDTELLHLMAGFRLHKEPTRAETNGAPGDDSHLVHDREGRPA